MSIREARAAVAPARALRDERGAVMVLGIFMCVCLVGVLWYLAGIGDAIVYRERMQEASDAVAFSAAVLHARGMNLIVLINLIMAVILGIRVALKIVQLALGIAGVIFTALGMVPWLAFFQVPGQLSLQGAQKVNNALNQINPRIDDALAALNKAETAIARAVPPAAMLGSLAVGRKYRPTVRESLGFSLDAIKSGLPVEEGTEDRLCMEAGRAVGQLFTYAIQIDALKGDDAVGEKFGDFLGNIAKGGAGYFCEMGSGGSAPDIDSMLDDGAKESCDAKREDLVKKRDAASQDWHAVCDEHGIYCVDNEPFSGNSSMGNLDALEPADRAELISLKNTFDTQQANLDAFNGEQCRKDEKKEMKEKFEESGANSQTTEKGSSDKKTPKKVKADWKNGVQEAQLVALTLGNHTNLRIAPKGVRIGGWKKTAPGDVSIPMSAEFAIAQAEFFFDCSGKWDTSSCNNADGDMESAMWHFKWRARLRRYSRPIEGIGQFGEGAAWIETMARGVKSANALKVTSFNNTLLKKELIQMSLSAISDTKDAFVH